MDKAAGIVPATQAPTGAGLDLRPMLRRLELHVTHACNLACESCSHYSNQGHKGHISLAEAESWMSAWNGKIRVACTSLLGGEPTVHPDFPQFIPLVRRHWPRTQIEIVTNGFFLSRHPALPALMREAGNCVLFMSIHHNDPAYLKRVEEPLALLQEWREKEGMDARIRPAFKNWTRRYTGFGDGMKPYADGDTRKSWEICPSRWCKQLYDGKLWKCPPLTYLPLQAEKYNLSAEWDPYLAYEALDPDCAPEELAAFLKLEDEAVCGMCPSHPRHFELPNPMLRAKG
ncbi:MAG: radical SAM protein [Rhizobiales bacterium]|nr:radical SAM protein [Hyphomicrobiales bacterium]